MNNISQQIDVITSLLGELDQLGAMIIADQADLNLQRIAQVQQQNPDISTMVQNLEKMVLSLNTQLQQLKSATQNMSNGRNMMNVQSGQSAYLNNPGNANVSINEQGVNVQSYGQPATPATPAMAPMPTL